MRRELFELEQQKFKDSSSQGESDERAPVRDEQG